MGPVLEPIPARIGGGQGIERPFLRVPALFVEIPAVCAGVAEHTVQQHPNTETGGRFGQRLKVLGRAQQGIHRRVVGGIVPMIGMRLKNRVEIQAGNAQLRQPVEPLLDAFQIPAEIVIVADRACGVGPPFRLSAPIAAQHPVGRHAGLRLL